MLDLLGEQDEERAYLETAGVGRDSDFYTGSEQYAREIERIFSSRWLAVDHVSRFPDTGSYTTVDVGTSSLLLMRGENRIQAYHNFCRHRGFKLVEEPCGKRKNIVCPYHSWVYSCSGELKKHSGTFPPERFDLAANGLLAVATEVRFGIVFVCFDEMPTDLDEALGDFGMFADRYELESLECTVAKDYPVQCNWKLVAHNVNESLHFPSAHKDLHRITDYDAAGTYVLRGDVVGAWQLIREGNNSVAMSGRSDRAPIPQVPEEDIGKINWITILPHLLLGMTSDYVMMQWVWPESPESCYVRHLWLFHPSETAKSTFSHDAVFVLWDKANLEDWELCERTHRGVRNSRWTPGQLTYDEEVVSQIDAWVAAHTATGDDG